MPLYTYHCDPCGHHEEDVFERIKADPRSVCPACADAGFHRVPTLPHTNLIEFHKPIEMFSIGLNDDAEIAEFQRRCPDVRVETDPRSELYGIPVAANRAQKMQALKASGFTEIN